MTNLPPQSGGVNGGPNLNDTTNTLGSNFPIVGLGASAGGLAALEAFFSGIPADTDLNMAFVLVQHLAPDHKSLLVGLLSKHTQMKVYEATNGTVVQTNCVYIIPPNCDMALQNGSLRLLELSLSRRPRFPIDFFFGSMAQDLRKHAICVVLSGTGSDGTAGLRAIKNEGGMAIVQSPELSEFNGMPCSAINTGLVDFVMPAEEMVSQLIKCVDRIMTQPSQPLITSHDEADEWLQKILVLLRLQTGHNFSDYKMSTISRRIEKHMATYQMRTLETYFGFLRENPEEVNTLFRSFLIGVTNFFRDSEAFDELEKQIISVIFKPPPGKDIRAWVCGCSTGEEAYTIAILCHEQLERSSQYNKVQIFASDIDGNAIDSARQGIFPSSIANNVKPERLTKYFLHDESSNTYRIRKTIRDMLVFSKQDVIKDPPFSKLDLISCRNLMIYMSPELQKKVLSVFHYALNADGFLMLGTSETVGDCDAYFNTIDRKNKLYQCKKQNDFPKLQNDLRTRIPRIYGAIKSTETSLVMNKSNLNMSLQELAEKALLQQVVHAGILVNAQGDILYLHGRTGMYLEPATGGADAYNILKMAREGLQSDLSIALHKAMTTQETVHLSDLQVKTNGDFSAVNLSISPVSEAAGAALEATLFLVMLAQSQNQTFASNTQNTFDSPSNKDYEERLITLQQALRDKDHYIRSSTEQQQASSEELKSANEELQSINEELQSTNEELETSKEELQSVNEELATSNAELQSRLIDLSRVKNDIDNLVTGTGIGTIFVDMQLNILRFTPGATDIIKLISTDLGRPVGHLSSTLVGYDNLENDIQSVLKTLIPIEQEVQTTDDLFFSMRILPYRTIDNRIEGAVINFLDVTERKLIETSLEEANKLSRLAVVVRDSYDAVILQDREGKIMAWNPSAQNMYGWSESEALTLNIREMIPQHRLNDELEKITQLSLQNEMAPYLTQRITKNGSLIDVWLTASELKNANGVGYAIATTERSKEIKDHGNCQL